jgi:Putative Flp pilus-assembly TadE/G-like
MRRRTHEAGQVLPLVAICLAALMGFAALAVDVGYAEYQQRQQQSATDAGAIAGAQQLLYSGCGDSSAASTAAIADATKNGFTNGSNGVTVTTTLGAGVFSGNTCAVQVQITAPHPRFFSNLFTFGNNVTTQAGALVAAPGGPPADAYFTNPNYQTSCSGCTMTLHGGAMLSNGTYSFAGATVSAGQIGYAGSTPSSAGTSFTNATPAPSLPFADPCLQIAGCTYLTNNAPSTSSCQPLSVVGGTRTVSPGCYSTVSISGATVTFDPGLYVITSSFGVSGATLTGSGVTFYAANNASVSMAGATATLTAPTTGNYANILYYQVPSDTSDPSFGGATENLTGVIYAPGAANMSFAGSGGGYTLLITGGMSAAGADVNFPSHAPGQAYIKQAVLAE